jgi:hypothetical protein
MPFGIDIEPWSIKVHLSVFLLPLLLDPFIVAYYGLFVHAKHFGLRITYKDGFEALIFDKDIWIIEF